MIGKRQIFGVTIGIVTGIIANMLIVQIGMMVYPPSVDVDPNDIEAMTEMIAVMPLGQLMFTYVGHLAQVGAWVQLRDVYPIVKRLVEQGCLWVVSLPCSVC